MNEAVAQKILAMTLARPATLGGSRLVCIDGPAGSGKTTLAAAVAARHPCVVVHLDDLYPGWSGLAEAPALVARGIIAPMREGLPGAYRRYDWVRGEFVDEVEVPVVDLLVLEGVGCGHSSYAHAITALVYVDAPREVRLARGLARDGEALRSQWLRWQADEDRLLQRQRVRERADLVVRT